MRWVLCWYGKAAVNRPVAGSIPATAALLEFDIVAGFGRGKLGSNNRIID